MSQRIESTSDLASEDVHSAREPILSHASMTSSWNTRTSSMQLRQPESSKRASYVSWQSLHRSYVQHAHLWLQKRPQTTHVVLVNQPRAFMCQ